MWARHCDGPECDTWQRQHAELDAGFLAVVQKDSRALRFCSVDCLLRRFATVPPIEVHSGPGDL